MIQQLLGAFLSPLNLHTQSRLFVFECRQSVGSHLKLFVKVVKRSFVELEFYSHALNLCCFPIFFKNLSLDTQLFLGEIFFEQFPCSVKHFGDIYVYVYSKKPV